MSIWSKIIESVSGNVSAYFYEEVIREIVNNSSAHRDYRKNSEIVIKQYPNKLVIQNAGGFPQGVTLDNLLTVPSNKQLRKFIDELKSKGMLKTE